MAMPSYEIPTEMRDFAEKSVDQARKAFEGFMTAAQKATGTVGNTAEAVHAQAKGMGSKAMSYAEENINAAFDHAKKLMRAKDIQEVMSLQAEYVKTQMATIQTQAKEFGGLVQGAAKSATGA